MRRLTLVSVAILICAACATTRRPMATANLQSISGSTAQGTVQMQELKDGSVEVTLNMNGVPPGVHGFHVHEKGDCGDNGNAAGPHFNPMSMPHSAPDAASRHSGDFGNVTANENGEIRTSFTTRSITLREGMMSAVGRATILHSKPDDLSTQPGGNAGQRIACGVLTLMDMGTMK